MAETCVPDEPYIGKRELHCSPTCLLDGHQGRRFKMRAIFGTFLCFGEPQGNALRR
jgi:hypothetical protein